MMLYFHGSQEKKTGIRIPEQNNFSVYIKKCSIADCLIYSRPIFKFIF